MAAENKNSFVIELVIGMVAVILYLSAFSLHKSEYHTPAVTNVDSQNSRANDQTNSNVMNNKAPSDVSGIWYFQENGKWIITQEETNLNVEVYNLDNSLASTGSGVINNRRVTITLSDPNVNVLVDVILADDEQSMIGTVSVEKLSGSESTIVLKR